MAMEFKSYYLDTPIIKGRMLDVFVPEKITRDIAVFFVHGGGWRAGTRQSYHKIMEALIERGYVVASTDYRLNAKDAFEQLKDVRESYDKFVSVLKEMDRPLKISVHGESAGAHLASLMIFAEPGKCGEQSELTNEWVKPVMASLQATPYDFMHWEGMMPQFWGTMQNIAGAPYDEDPERYERLSLKNYVNETNPPIFFLEAELEHLFLPEHTLKIAKKHREMGINSQWKMYPRVEHGFFYELKRKAQLEAFEDMCAFLEGKLSTDF